MHIRKIFSYMIIAGHIFLPKPCLGQDLITTFATNFYEKGQEIRFVEDKEKLEDRCKTALKYAAEETAKQTPAGKNIIYFLDNINKIQFKKNENKGMDIRFPWKHNATSYEKANYTAAELNNANSTSSDDNYWDLEVKPKLSLDKPEYSGLEIKLSKSDLKVWSCYQDNEFSAGISQHYAVIKNWFVNDKYTNNQNTKVHFETELENDKYLFEIGFTKEF